MPQPIGPIINRIAEDAIWNIIEKKDWDRIFIPLIVLGRLDQLLAEAYTEQKKKGNAHKKAIAMMTKGASPQPYQNSWVEEDHFEAGSPLAWIGKHSKDIPADLKNYLAGFPKDCVDIFQTLELLPNDSNGGTINLLEAKGKMAKKNILAILIKGLVEKIEFSEFDENSMGDAFEDCIRMFNEQKKTDAGEHYTPRDAIGLLARLLLNGDIPDDKEQVEFYDPTSGTGGILIEGLRCLRARCLERRVSSSCHIC